MRLGFLFVLVFAVPVFVFAQTIPTVDTPLDLELRPSSPRPGDTVTVRALNVPSDPDAKVYVWRVNGSVVDQGAGVIGTTFIAGSAGSATTVSVEVRSGSGEVVAERSITIRPASVDIVWEGNTYTPPFFPGRPLPTGSSRVTLQAIPDIVQNGVRLSASGLAYRWYVNDRQTPFAMGLGRSSVTMEPPAFANQFSVSVTEATPGGTVESRGFATIDPVSPEVAVYEVAPLLGTRFDRAVVSQLPLEGDEVSLEAFPLYVKDVRDLTYQWRLNGKTVEEVRETPRQVTFRKQGTGTGNFAVSFSMESARELFERATTGFQLTF